MTLRKSGTRCRKSSPTAPPPSWSRSGAEVLKRVIIGYGIVAVLGAFVLAGLGVGSPVVLYLFVNGLILIAALVFERGRYRPPMTSGGSWQETAERFVDPTTGQLMKVRYNPQTGATCRSSLHPDADNHPFRAADRGAGGRRHWGRRIAAVPPGPGRPAFA